MTTSRRHLRRTAAAVATTAGVAVSALIAPAASSAAVQSHTIPFGRWIPFDVGAPGSYDSQGAFTFTSDSNVIVRVTDGFCRGDRYRLLDHGRRVLLTSKVAVDTSCQEQPFDTTAPPAWRDPTYSKGKRLLGPGSHRLRLRAFTSPFGGSTGWVEVLRVKAD